jgi:Shwachman-Bodian-Diamond syndrome (SBDS) protein
MPRGNAAQVKVHYQGKDEDFIIYVDDVDSVQKWKKDRSIPLAQVVSGFKIFVTHKLV